MSLRSDSILHVVCFLKQLAIDISQPECRMFELIESCLKLLKVVILCSEPNFVAYGYPQSLHDQVWLIQERLWSDGN